MDIKNMLIDLSNAYGVGGMEAGVQATLKHYLQHIGEVSTDHNGNLLCKVLGNKQAKRKILLDAHLDEIGFVVTAITEEGFLKLGAVGGIDARLLLSTPLVVQAKGGPVPGIVSCFAPHLSAKDKTDEIKPVEDLFLDIGYTKAQAQQAVALGDFVSFDVQCAPLQNGYYTGKSLDNRASCVAIALAGHLAKEGNLQDIDLTLAFSTKEETGGSGAKTAAYPLEIDTAVVVDTTFGTAPNVSGEESGALEKGVMIGVAPSLDRAHSERLISLAKKGDIPHQIEVMGGRTGTNAESYVVDKGGIQTALLSIPIRNMHGPVEVVHLKDIESTANLLFAFLKEGTPC